jgi:hypothetical protein
MSFDVGCESKAASAFVIVLSGSLSLCAFTSCVGTEDHGDKIVAHLSAGDISLFASHLLWRLGLRTSQRRATASVGVRPNSQFPRR